jgi:hypothetical protein
MIHYLFRTRAEHVAPPPPHGTRAARRAAAAQLVRVQLARTRVPRAELEIGERG